MSCGPDLCPETSLAILSISGKHSVSIEKLYKKVICSEKTQLLFLRQETLISKRLFPVFLSEPIMEDISIISVGNKKQVLLLGSS